MKARNWASILFLVDRGELVEVLGQRWSNLVGAVFRKINQMAEWGKLRS